MLFIQLDPPSVDSACAVYRLRFCCIYRPSPALELLKTSFFSSPRYVVSIYRRALRRAARCAASIFSFARYLPEVLLLGVS